MKCQFGEKGRIAREPVARFLPFPLVAHMITILLVWSVVFMAMWITVVVVMPEVIAAQPRELFPRREEVPPHPIHCNFQPEVSQLAMIVLAV